MVCRAHRKKKHPRTTLGKKRFSLIQLPLIFLFFHSLRLIALRRGPRDGKEKQLLNFSPAAFNVFSVTSSFFSQIFTKKVWCGRSRRGMMES